MELRRGGIRMDGSALFAPGSSCGDLAGLLHGNVMNTEPLFGLEIVPVLQGTIR